MKTVSGDSESPDLRTVSYTNNLGQKAKEGAGDGDVSVLQPVVDDGDKRLVVLCVGQRMALEMWCQERDDGSIWLGSYNVFSQNLSLRNHP
jgi:hypothetical protein